MAGPYSSTLKCTKYCAANIVALATILVEKWLFGCYGNYIFVPEAGSETLKVVAAFARTHATADAESTELEKKRISWHDGVHSRTAPFNRLRWIPKRCQGYAVNF